MQAASISQYIFTKFTLPYHFSGIYSVLTAFGRSLLDSLLEDSAALRFFGDFLGEAFFLGDFLPVFCT